MYYLFLYLCGEERYTDACWLRVIIFNITTNQFLYFLYLFRTYILFIYIYIITYSILNMVLRIYIAYHKLILLYTYDYYES